MSEVNKVVDNGSRLVESFVRKGMNIGLNDVWLSRAVNSMFYRGFMKDMDVHLRRLKVCQDRNHELINREFIGDGRSATKDNGHYSYSGVGKTAGIETLAVLSKYATDDQIERFYELLKQEKIPMKSVKQIFKDRYGIDFTSIII